MAYFARYSKNEKIRKIFTRSLARDAITAAWGVDAKSAGIPRNWFSCTYGVLQRRFTNRPCNSILYPNLKTTKSRKCRLSENFFAKDLKRRGKWCKIRNSLNAKPYIRPWRSWISQWIPIPKAGGSNPSGRARKEVTFVYQKLLLFYPSRRLGISSAPLGLYIITRQRVFLLRLDEIQHFVLMICNATH